MIKHTMLPSSCILLVYNIAVTTKILIDLSNTSDYSAIVSLPAVYMVWFSSVLNLYKGITETSLLMSFLLTSYFTSMFFFLPIE